jgi:acyl-CoA dehydrogenase
VTSDAAQTLEGLRGLARDAALEGALGLEALDETAAARRALELVTAAGLTTWVVPARDGGADAGDLAPAESVSVRAVCAIRDELAYHSGMLDVMLVMQGLGSFPVALGGSAELRKNVLSRVARGELVAAFALTEPNAGSSLGEVATRAERTGDGWRLDGQKTFISNAGIADGYSVLARTSGEPGDGGTESLTMFYVPGDASGLRTERFEVMSPHPIGDVTFDGVELGAENVLGDVGGGLKVALATLGRFRTSVAAAACGFARRALDESKERLGQRQQFGRPLGTFQALRFDIAEMDTRLRAAQLLVDEAAEAVDRGAAATLEVARAKLFATETASWICDRAVQHFGGLGVKRGTVVERLFREVRALRIYEGTSEIQKLVLSKELLSRKPDSGKTGGGA